MRFETLKLVEDAIGRMDEPVTLRPPARIVSPAETRRPLEESRPAAVRPPVNDDDAAPCTWRMLPTVRAVVEALGKVDANVVEVAVKMEAVGEEVAAMLVKEVK